MWFPKISLGKSWKCKICGKKFPTPQALGGHLKKRKKGYKDA